MHCPQGVSPIVDRNIASTSRCNPMCTSTCSSLKESPARWACSSVVRQRSENQTSQTATRYETVKAYRGQEGARWSTGNLLSLSNSVRLSRRNRNQRSVRLNGNHCFVKLYCP